MADQSILSPAVQVWTLTFKKTGEQRDFNQSELTIDGEAALMGLASRAIGELNAQGIPISAIGSMADLNGNVDWGVVTRLFTQASPLIPKLGSEAAAILFGYYPMDEMFKPEADWAPTVKWLRGAITIPLLVDFLQTFVAQNDYKRLSGPFAAAVRAAATLGQSQAPSPTPLEPSPS